MIKYFEYQLFGYKYESNYALILNNIMLLTFITPIFFYMYKGGVIHNGQLITDPAPFLLSYMGFMMLANIIDFAVQYKVPVKSKMDLKRNNFVTKRINLVALKLERSASGPNGSSRVNKAFDKSLSVCRCRLYYVTEDGKRGYVRLLLSLGGILTFKRYISDIKNMKSPKNEEFEITYLKSSKVLYNITPIEESKNASDFIETVFVLSKPKNYKEKKDK